MRFSSLRAGAVAVALVAALLAAYPIQRHSGAMMTPQPVTSVTSVTSVRTVAGNGAAGVGPTRPAAEPTTGIHLPSVPRTGTVHTLSFQRRATHRYVGVTRSPLPRPGKGEPRGRSAGHHHTAAHSHDRLRAAQGRRHRG